MPILLRGKGSCLLPHISPLSDFPHVQKYKKIKRDHTPASFFLFSNQKSPIPTVNQQPPTTTDEYTYRTVMAAPAYTPVATNPFTGGFPSSDEASAAASSAANFGLGYLQKLREERLSSLRPAGEFFDRNRFSLPSGFASTSSTCFFFSFPDRSEDEERWRSKMTSGRTC